MSLAAIRQSMPHLNDYSDQELMDVVAKTYKINPGTPQYKQLESNLLGYDRSAIDTVKDTGVAIGQGVLGAAKGLVTLGAAAIPGVKAFDNPVSNYLDTLSDRAGKDKSAGIRNREAGAALNVDIAQRNAAAEGDGFWGQIGAEAKAVAGNYASNPQLAVQDAIGNLPMMVGPAAVGRGGQAAGLAMRMSEKGALRLGTAAGVGTAAEMQGADVGGDAYKRLKAAGATDEEAASGAGVAALKGGAATVGLSMLPFGSTIERSMLRGATTGPAGMGAVARRAVSAGVEAADEATEEGYGQYAQNQAVRAKDGKTNLATGIGQAAVQGAVVAGPLGAMSAHGGPHEHTADGNIDLTRSAPTQAAPLDVPTFQRQNLDPLNERPVGPNLPVTDPSMADIANPVSPSVQTTAPSYTDLVSPAPVAPVDPYTDWQNQANAGAADAARAARRTAADTGTSAQGAGVMLATPDGTVLPAQSPEQLQALEQSRQAAAGSPELVPVPTKGQVLSSLAGATAEVGASVTNKDGSISKTKAAAPIRKVLESADPIAAIRDVHQDGNGSTDELLDAWHKRLTGQTVFDYKAAQAAQAAPVNAVNPETNSAGFVPEPATQVAAQLDAVREGRKPAAVMGAQEAAQAKTDGLITAPVTDSEGNTAVVAARDQATVDQAATRTKEVGLKQAMGETLGVADPSQTTNPHPDAVAVQQVDNNNGQVVAEELSHPDNVGNVTPVAGTTPRVISPQQVLAERQAAPAVSPVQAEVAPAPKAEKGPRLGKKTTAELVEMAETSKDENEYKSARYELYKRWSDNGSQTAENYLTNKANRSDMSKAEEAGFKRQYAEELKARGEKKAKALAKKFGASYRTNPEPNNNTYIAPAATRSVVDAMTKNWGTLPEIEVVDNTGGLPARLRTQMEEDGVVNPKGAFFGGKVWIVSDSHQSSSDVVATVLHEVAGHFGLRGVLGSTYAQTMAQVYAGNAAVRALADPMMASEGLTKELATEEVLADMAQKGPVTPSIADRILNSIRQVMRRVGLTKLVQGVTNTEVNEIVANARAFVESQNVATDTSEDAVYRRTVRESVVEPLADAARTVAAEVAVTVSGREISPKLLSLMTMRQIDEQFGGKLPAIKDWIGALMERGSNASKIAAEADRVALQWEQSVKDPAERKALADVLLQASVNELELDNYTPKYMNSLDAKSKQMINTLRAKLDALSPEARTTRRQALDVLSRQWEYTRKSLESFINQTVPDPGLRNAQIEKLKELMGRTRGDYFPLSRFGDRIVVARNAAPDGRDIVTFHETAASAEAELNKWSAQNVRASITLNTKGEVGPRQNSGLMGDLHKAIDESGADTEAKNELHESLQQLFLKSLPELSGAKFMIRRENVEGYSRDALRVFADAVTKGARYASHLEYGPRIQAAQEAARTQSKSEDSRTAAVIIGRKDGVPPTVMVVPVGTERLNAVEKLTREGFATEFFNTAPDTAKITLQSKLPGLTPAMIDAHVKSVADVAGDRSQLVDDTRGAKALYNHMLKMQAPSEPSNAVVDALGKVGYVWFLGLSPAFWAMNTLQNPMIGLPQLGSKFGVANSSREWLGAVKWFSTIRMGKLIAHDKTPFSIDWLKDQVKNGTVKGINKEEMDMLQTLEDRQVLDFTQAMDLSRIGEASSDTSYKAMRFAAAGAHHTEVFNRVTFALAAYRLAMKSGSGITHETAVKSAENDVVASHFDYSSSNKPTLMRGKTSRLMFMFQQYRQHMLYWWAKNVKDMIKNEAPGDRVRATKAALLMGTTHAVMAGALGLPFIGTVSFLANLFGGKDDDGEPFDFDAWIKDAAIEATGSQKAGEIMANGIFAAVGMNIGKRIGQPDLLPFLNNNGSAKFEKSPDDKARAYLFDMLGPLGSIALSGAKSLDSFSKGDMVGGMAAVTPKAISDVLKAYKLDQEGLKDKQGNAIATAESFDGSDVLMQAAGVQPTKIANIRADASRVRDIDQAIQDRSRRIEANFVDAWQRGDQAGMTETLDDVRKFNASVSKYKDSNLLINSTKLESAIKDRKMKAMMLALTGGAAENRRQLMIATQASGLFNQVTPESMRENLPGLPGLPGLK